MNRKNPVIEVTQIVPRLRPATDGVGEYALILAKELLNQYAIKTKFIICDPSWNGPTQIDGFEVKVIKQRSVSAILQTLDNSSNLLLHYVGYGYAKKGCPLWLSKALHAHNQRLPGNVLVIYFHELVASGMPWSSAFWLRPLQRFVVRSLAQISLSNTVSNGLYAKMLTSYMEKKIEPDILPICSLVGEGIEIKTLEKKDASLVIFGTLGRRLAVYRNASKYLKILCKSLNIKEIIDIGALSEDIAEEMDSIPIKKMGILAEVDIRKIMSRALVGVLDYPLMLLGKSSIFATYSSFGLLPVILGNKQSNESHDGICAGKQYWHQDQIISELTKEKLCQISQAACKWYQSHNTEKHAQHFAQIFDANSCSDNIVGVAE